MLHIKPIIVKTFKQFNNRKKKKITYIEILSLNILTASCLCAFVANFLISV